MNYFNFSDAIFDDGKNFVTQLITDCGNLHSHDFFEISYLIKGNAEHKAFNEKVTLSNENMIIIRPGDLHAYNDKPLPNTFHRDIIVSINESAMETQKSAEEAEGIFETQISILGDTKKVFEEINVNVGNLSGGLNEIQNRMDGIVKSKDHIVDAISTIMSVSEEITAMAEDVNTAIEVEKNEIVQLSKDSEVLKGNSDEMMKLIERFEI